jgi:FkbM family methyltransferase
MSEEQRVATMSRDALARLLKRWRDDYYVSTLLAGLAKPACSFSGLIARQLQQRIRKNGVTIWLPNRQPMTIARDSGIGLASLLFWHGLDGFEPYTSRILRSIFERSTTFVDVGANYGFYSVLGAQWNQDLRVVAFEPVKEIFGGLLRNVEANSVAGRVRCENLALSGRSGRAALFLPKSETMDLESTGTLASESWQCRKGSPQIEIEAIRFDEYEAGHRMQVDLVKIDVEDFEADVLEGMRSVILRDRPFIVCEVLPRKHGNARTLATIESLRYQPYWITPVGCIRVARFDFERGNFTDFLFSPVSTQDAVLDSLETLYELRRAMR